MTHGSPVRVRIILVPIAQLETFQIFLKATLLTTMDHIMASLWAVEFSVVYAPQVSHSVPFELFFLFVFNHI